MTFEEKYNKLCDKLNVQKYYIMDINFGDLDSNNWKVQGYKSARQAYYADDHRDYTEDYEDLSFKERYKKNVNTADSDIEYRYPLFDDKVREILSCFNEYVEQRARDDKIYNQVYNAIDEEDYDE